MRARERISSAVGNVFNDLYRQLLFSFELLFFMKVVELSASEAGLILLIGQVADALFCPISGYLGDRVKVPFLSKKIGARKSWHLLATIVMAISLPLLFNRCFLCDGRDQSWLPLIYFGFFSALVNICFGVVEINHFAFITSVAETVEECTVLSAMRTVFSFLSGVYIYVIAWGLLGQESGDTLGPNSLSDFAYLSWIASGTGVFFATIFHIGAKEPRNRLRKISTHSDIINVSGILLPTVFESAYGGSRRNSIAYAFVDMLMATSNYEKSEEQGIKETESHEEKKRKRSLLQKFVSAILHDEENNSGQDQSQSVTEEATNNPENEDARTRMILEVKHLDRDRKKSLLVRVLDGLRLRLEENQQELTIGSIEDQAALCSADGEHITGQDYCRQEGIGSVPNEDRWKTHNSLESVDGEYGNEGAATDTKDQNTVIPKISVCNHSRKRKHAVVANLNGGKNGLPNFGFEYDKSDDAESGNRRISSVRKPKKSVTFSAPAFPEVTSTNEKRQREFNLDDLGEKETIQDESTQIHLTQNILEDKRMESSEGINSSTLKDNPDVLGLAHSSAVCSPQKKRPKRIKDWLRDPNLYKVAIIFTCSRLAQDAVYGYLPLFLTERLLFPKEAIAYFPLILLISASVASLICNRLNRKIGSKWCYLLAASFVLGGGVWSYFQTTSIRQSTYAPMVIIGSGLSIMYVMALVFITELIGEDKETSGSVVAIITVIARLSSGGLVIGIQEFYPEEGSNEAISSYVRHVFAMAPGILTLVALLLVLIFQPSKFSCKTKASKDVKAQDDSLSFDVRVPQSSSEKKTAPDARVNLDGNQNYSMATEHSFSEDTKL